MRPSLFRNGLTLAPPPLSRGLLSLRFDLLLRGDTLLRHSLLPCSLRCGGLLAQRLLGLCLLLKPRPLLRTRLLLGACLLL